MARSACIHMTNVQVADYKKQQLNQKVKYTHLQEQPKVMVVDDIVLNRKLLCTGFKDHYPHPTQFKNGEQAVQAYKTQAVKNAYMIILWILICQLWTGAKQQKLSEITRNSKVYRRLSLCSDRK